MPDGLKPFGQDLADRLFEGIAKKNRVRLAKAISLVEDGSPHSARLLSLAFKSRGNSNVIGITGAPGVGKSSLVHGLISSLRQEDRSVGVIAVDPSSPFTGGAILGDRVRVLSHTTDDNVFFRSLATRGHLGGLSRHTGDIITLFDAYGFDDIIVETVGAGQSEVDIMKYAHTVVVVLAPGLGDDVQAIKAGIMEIADVLCVNKADLPGVARTVRELEMMLHLKEEQDWCPPIIETVASGSKGVTELLAAIREHQQYLGKSGSLVKKTKDMSRAVLEEYLKANTVDVIMEKARHDGILDKVIEDMISGLVDPIECSKRLIQRYLPEN